MSAFLSRPFRLQTARELAFLLLGGLTAIVGFAVQVAGLSAGISLLITFIGIPILLALAVVDRLVRREAYVMAYNDGFWIIGMILLGCIAAIWMADKVKSPGGGGGGH